MTILSRTASRRDFLTTSSLALAGTVFGTRALQAEAPAILPRNSPFPADAFIPARMPVPELHALTAHALDAARSAGATYADIRIAECQRLNAQLGNIFLSTQFTYGVRAMVNSAWGFAYGRAPTADAVAQCAREAVVNARLAAQLSAGRPTGTSADTWVPASVVTGEWRTPIQVDPFTVPVEQHAESRGAMIMAVNRVPGAKLGVEIEWVRETRVVGATTGTLVTQHLHRVLPWMPLSGRVARSDVGIGIPVQHFRSAGYEILLAPDLLDQIKTGAEEAMRLARLPMRPLDVGRYPIVFDGAVMGNILGRLLGPSLELDRVLGHEAEASGTSRMTLDLLGTSVASPLLTVRGNRAVPSVTAVQWDDEGNVPREHIVLKDGVLTDYHSNGQTVSALTSWYQKDGRAVRSNGCAVAPEANNPVAVRAPHLAMQASESRMSFDDLCHEIGHGVVAVSDAWMTTDQQLSSGSISPWSCLFEISRGQIVRRLKGMGLQFNTMPLFKAITAIGDRTTLRPQNVKTEKGMPWIDYRSGTLAPAVLCKEINVISTHL